MSSLPSVALLGATGNLGRAVLIKLLAANFPVTILTRQGSTSTASLPSHPNQTIKEVDYTSKDSLVEALTGTTAVVSTLASTKVGDQDTIIDAALATGTVKRFLPSEFGSDTHHPSNIHLPVFAGKRATVEYLQKITTTHPDFTYTLIENNAFLDWGLTAGFVIDPKSHTATLWNGGDVPYSTTTLATVGDTVVAVLKNLNATANKTVAVHDAVVTQNQLIELVKSVDGVEWTTTVKSTEEEEKESWEELKKENPNFGKAMVGFLRPAIWGKAAADYSKKADNELLGLKTLSDEEVKEVVRKVVKGEPTF